MSDLWIVIQGIITLVTIQPMTDWRVTMGGGQGFNKYPKLVEGIYEGPKIQVLLSEHFKFNYKYWITLVISEVVFKFNTIKKREGGREIGS